MKYCQSWHHTQLKVIGYAPNIRFTKIASMKTSQKLNERKKRNRNENDILISVCFRLKKNNNESKVGGEI